VNTMDGASQTTVVACAAVAGAAAATLFFMTARDTKNGAKSAKGLPEVALTAAQEAALADLVTSPISPVVPTPKHLGCRAGKAALPSYVATRNCLEAVYVTDKPGTPATMMLGNACSEIFSGANLARMLHSGHMYETNTLAKLAAGEPAPPLVQHTAAGLPAAIPGFVDAIARHLPKAAAEAADWCVSPQLEGATAVQAGYEMLMLLQEKRGNKHRTQIAVADRSYHGPHTTCIGVPPMPLPGTATVTKPGQITYPAPHPFRAAMDGGTINEKKLLAEWLDFFKKHGPTLGVLVLEPQWGSSCASACWPPHLLKEIIALAHKAGALVLCDEVMCGLGRHGLGCCFLAEAWGLDVDAVTFGKAVATGAFQMSGAILLHGQREMQGDSKVWKPLNVRQSHTYASANTRALLAATAVLDELYATSCMKDQIAASSAVLKKYMTEVGTASKGKFSVHGHGLMMGCLLDPHMPPDQALKVKDALQKACKEEYVLPYYVPPCGFQVTPPYDVTPTQLAEAGRRLVAATAKVAKQFGW